MIKFVPKRTKFNKSFKLVYLSNKVKVGKFRDFKQSFGLQVKVGGFITANQMESIRRVLTKFLKVYNGNFLLNFCASIPVTKKPIETRMGKGKGNVHYWIQRVSAGQVLLEVRGVSKSVAIQACLKCKVKLGIKTQIIFK